MLVAAGFGFVMFSLFTNGRKEGGKCVSLNISFHVASERGGSVCRHSHVGFDKPDQWAGVQGCPVEPGSRSNL